LPLIEDQAIQVRYLVTLRRGELVRDTVGGAGITRVEEELIKFREHPGGGCVFYGRDAKECTIYDRRPSECEVLQCWDTAKFFDVYVQPNAIRKDIVSDGVLLGLIKKHEDRCSYAALDEHIRGIQEYGEEAIASILDLMKFDYALRPFVANKLGLPMDEMDFYFGRPLLQTIVMFGLKVDHRSDGTFYLTQAV
jgi:Fe-S-cluster containining protein